MRAPNQSHFIQRFKFDFEIERKEDAHQLHVDLGRLFNQRIKQLLDEIMTELDDPAHVIRIPLLEIDLGEIYEGSLEKEVMMRLETAFRRALALRLGELRYTSVVSSPEKGEKVALMPARISIVSYFLVNGRLPNGAEQMAGKMEQLLLELLEDNPDQVVRMLKAVARTEAALKRLATAFSEKLVFKLYGTLVSENAISISSIERKLVAEAGKVVKKSPSVITMEVRRAIFRYLLVDPPPIFDRRKFQTAVTQAVIHEFGTEAEAGFADLKEAQEDFAHQNERRAKRQAAMEVLKRYLKGTVPSESPLMVMQAWEYLVTQDAQSLRKLLATKSFGVKAISELVKLLSPATMRDFVQKIVPSSPVQLIHVAASVVSAFTTFRKGASAEKRIAAEVYAALIHQLAINPSVTPTATKIAEAIKSHLAKIQDAPRELLKQWEELDLLGVTSAENKRKRKAQQEAADAKAEQEFEAKVAALKSRKKADLEEIEEEELAREAAEMVAAERKKAQSKSKAAADSEAAETEKDEEAAAEDAVDDETFFKRYREKLSKRGMEFEELTVPEEEVAFTIDTPEGRMELVLHMIVTGTRPWWSEPVSMVQLEIYLKNLISKHPEVVKAAFSRWVRTVPAAQYTEAVNRIISAVNETTLTNLLAVLAPDIAGFMTTVALALTELQEAATAESLNVPAFLAQRFHFIWHQQLRYVLEYMSSGYSAGQLVRYVLKQQAAALGFSSRQMIERMGAVAEAAIVKGEKRFIAFKSILPKTFEGLQVATPKPHEPLEEVWTKFLALEQAAAEREETGKEKTEEERAAEQGAEEDYLTPEERFLLERLKLARSVAQEEEREKETPEDKAAEETTEGRIEPTETTKTTETTESAEFTAPDQLPGDQEQPEKEADLTPEKKEKGPPSTKEKRKAETPEADRRIQEPKAELRELTPEEEEAEAATVLEAIRQYLEHGTLSAAATAYFTPATFRELLQGTFSLASRPLITMLRTTMTKSSARQRVISFGNALALQVIGLLQVMIADKMRPFTQDLIRLFDTSSSPVSRIHVLDHAMRFALQTGGTGFVPLNYVRDFVEYVAALPGRDVKEVLIWANKRLETSSSPLRDALLEVLDVVERIEQTQQQGQKKRKQQQVSSPSAPLLIKAPDGDIYITNAGAGIVHIIFKQLFKAFNLLKEDNLAFVSKEAASRAAHYIQYLTDKELDAPEEKMVFNKLLVGLPLEQPLEPLAEPLTQDEIDTCEYVMQTLCEKWTVMKNAGPDYMRKSFLMREGRLRSNGDGWIVRVEQTGLDVLKNKIPWATNPIRLPWLTYLIDVDWP